MSSSRDELHQRLSGSHLGRSLFRRCSEYHTQVVQVDSRLQKKTHVGRGYEDEDDDGGGGKKVQLRVSDWRCETHTSSYQDFTPLYFITRSEHLLAFFARRPLYTTNC